MNQKVNKINKFTLDKNYHFIINFLKAHLAHQKPTIYQT